MININKEIEELKEKFEDQIVRIEEYDQIADSEVVETIDNCGSSGKYNGYTWYNVIFKDGTEMSIYN